MERPPGDHPMKITLVHQLFADPGQPGGTRHYELARRLVARGHDVTAVASDLCYLTGERVTPRSALLTRERRDGITVLRTFTFPTLKRGLAGRILAFVSFMMTSLWAGMRAQRPDVVVGTSPPIFQLASAWLISLLRRCPFVLEVRDLWPAFLVDMGVLKNRCVIVVAEWIERFFYARAALIIVNSPAYMGYLVDKGIPEEKVRLIPNGVDPLAFETEPGAGERDATRRTYGLNGEFVVTYAGALGRANDWETVLDAAEQLRSDTDTRLLLVGDGSGKSQVQAEIAARRLENVSLAGGVPKLEMGRILAAADVCLATLRDIPMFRMTYPNKVFDYMAAARPTVLAIDGVIREVMETARGGICVPPGDAAAIAEAVRYLRSHREEGAAMGRSARQYVTEHFHRDDHAEALEAALLEVVA